MVPKGKEHGWPAEGHIDFEDLPRSVLHPMREMGASHHTC